MNDPSANRPGYKQTKIGWIPEEWRVASASTFAPFVTSGSRGWAEFYADFGALFVRITNLRRETPRPDLTDTRYVSLPLNTAEGRRTLLQRDDILISITADLGIIGHISQHFPSPAYISQHLAILRFPKEMTHDRQYLAYSLAGDRMVYHFYKVTDQGAKAGLNLDTIRQLPLILPPLPEQRKIAAILSTWDDAIEKTRALIAAKKQQKKALMQQLLTGKRRLPGFARRSELTNTPLGELPADWPLRSLHRVFGKVTRKNSRAVTRVLTASGESGLIDQRTFFTKSIASADVSGYYLIERGEFAYNRSAMTGYPYGAIKRLDAHDEGVLSTLYSCFAIRDKHAVSEFYTYFFEAGLLNRQLRRIAQVGGRAHGLLNITDSDFFGVLIPVPSLNEQRAIAEVLKTADSEIRSMETKLTALEQQKKGLMQKLLTGQVRVKG